ncbi:MAG: lysylphosphatidylglycerol synthase transmembrane domain-containing protein [Pseudomonadota bacterium]
MITRFSRLVSVLSSPLSRASLAAGLLGLILLKLDQAKVWEALKGFDHRIGLLMITLNSGLFFLFAARWRFIAFALGIRAPTQRFFQAIMLGGFFSQLGPPLIVGELTRFRLLRPFADKWSIAASQILDRLSGQIALLGLVLLLMPFYAGLFGSTLEHRILIVAAILALICTLGLIVLRRFKSLQYINPESIGTALNPFSTPNHYAASFAIQLLLMLNFTLAAGGIGAGHDSGLVFLLAPLVLSGVTMLPITFADWGTREAAALLFFSTTGMTAEHIVAASLVYGAANLLSALPGALFLTGSFESERQNG